MIKRTNKRGYERLTMEQPRYEHDCNICEFLGQYREYDLYYCLKNMTIIERYSDEGGDYSSGLVFGVIGHENCSREALVRALRTGHKQEIIEYFEKFHDIDDDDNKLIKFRELLLIAETDPKDYPTLINSLKYFQSYIEEHFKGENIE